MAKRISFHPLTLKAMRFANYPKFMAGWFLKRCCCQSLLLSCIIAVNAHAQIPPTPTLNLDGPAPPLRVREWIKGTPVKKFENGHVYVLEFWATWCIPCIAAMPHLSDLARQYRGKVTFIGMDIYEDELKPPRSISQVKAFVDSMGQNMDYTVAIEEINATVAYWLEASGEKKNGIPITFIVNREGKLAWIGRPTELDGVLSKIVDNTWDVKKALAERNDYRRLEELEDSVREQLNAYTGNPNNYDLGKPDSSLILIDKIVKKEPKLKYAPIIAYFTFSSLLKTDLEKAYEYGKAMLTTSSYRGTDYNNIIYPIEYFSEKTNLITLSAKFYELGAEAYQARIDHDSLSKESLPKIYLKMADWYWRGKNNAKAVVAAQKAVEAMQNKKIF